MSEKKLITNKSYFNPFGIDNADIVGGNPTGFVDFNDTSLPWATDIYDLMNSLAWFPSEVDMSNEAKSFQVLSNNEQMVYKLVLSNLSFLDSAQENHILDFRRNVSHKILQSALTLQAYQENNHSKTYAVILSEIGNSEEVFNMYKSEQILMDRNTRVASLFAKHINDSDANSMLGSAMASVLLEGVLFLTSFAYVFILGDKMQGSSSAVSFIAKDEISSHAPMFANIYKGLVKQNKIGAKEIDDTIDMMREAVSIETDFAKYICEFHPILGITEQLLIDTINNFANKRLRVIGLHNVFQETPKTQLQKLIDKYSIVNDTKSNLFESSNKGYAKDSIDMNDF